MSALIAITQATLRQALRDKVPYVLLFFGAVIIVGSEGFAVLAIGAPEKVAIDLGLSSIAFFGAAIAVFLGLSQLSQEISRRTIYTIVSKPIPRSWFMLGKVLGVYSTVFLLMAAMAILFFAFVGLRYGGLHMGLLAAVWLSVVEALVLTAIAVLFSTVTSTVLATLMTLTAYVIGHLAYGLEMLARFPSLQETVWPRVLMTIFYVLPNLEYFSVRRFAVHGDPLPNGLIFPTAYGFVYCAAVLLLSIEVFRRRDFE